MARTLKLVLWELAPLVPGFLYLFVRPGPWESHHPRWLTIALTVLYAGFLAYWLWILWRGGLSAVVATLERRAAKSKMSLSPLRQNMILALVALLLVGFVVVPILLKPN
jgi:hypothetical protein